MNRKHCLPAPQLAAMAGVSLTTWKQHVGEGAPAPETKAKLREWLVAYHAWRKQKKPGPGAPASTRDRGDDFWTTERKKYLALRSKLELAHARGKLVKRSEVERFATTAIVAVRQRLSDLVKKMSVRLFQAPTVEWIEEQLRTEIEAICRGFAAGLEVPEDERGAVPVAGSEDLEDLDAEATADGE